jgi:hypothetical protein
MAPLHHATANGPAAWRQRCACALDEARGAACLSLILATAVSLAGFGQTGWQWACLLGVPVWCAGRAARLL